MIDVSANNHPADVPIDWAKVKGAGYDAVMVKCSEGTDYVNPWLKDDADGATAARLKVGFYHFGRPGAMSPAAEARYARVAVFGLHHDLGLALDLEVQESRDWASLAAYARAFHHVIRETFAHSPLYVNDYFLANLPGAPWGERLWLAQTARPRREVWAWQSTTPIAVPGIPGLTDVNVLHPDA